MKTKCLRIPKISVEMSWIRFGGWGVAAGSSLWLWCGNGASAGVLCAVGAAGRCWELWWQMFHPFPALCSLKPYCPPGEPQKKKKSSLGFSQPMDPTGNAVLGCKKTKQKTKITPQKTCKWASRAFCAAPHFGEEMGSEELWGLKGSPVGNWILPLVFRMNTKISPQILAWGETGSVQFPFCCCYTEFKSAFSNGLQLLLTHQTAPKGRRQSSEQAGFCLWRTSISLPMLMLRFWSV